MNDFYAEIDKELRSHERGEEFPNKTIHAIVDDIYDAWKGGNLSKEEAAELAERALNIICA